MSEATAPSGVAPHLVSSSCGHFDVALLHQPLCSHVALKNFYLTRSAPILAVTENPALSVGLGLFPGVGSDAEFLEEHGLVTHQSFNKGSHINSSNRDLSLRTVLLGQMESLWGPGHEAPVDWHVETGSMLSLVWPDLRPQRKLCGTCDQGSETCQHHPLLYPEVCVGEWRAEGADTN